ncbi:MAG: nitrile hydratase subunit alpha [Deltaproteobacteria bacterium]|nr:nitrile hydratase subunit alpha [Deltaproteobacteria bacterium]
MAHEHEPGEEHEAGPRHELSHWAKRAYAMREILIEKGVVTEDDIRRQAEFTESKTPANGARLVALAWTDPEFKARFMADPKKVCAEMGIDASTLNEFVILENTEKVRHMVVCTLCSCYPRPILGRPPDWYKSFNYRKRAVNDPRGVMREFGLDVPDDVEVRVHDSTADMRYLVIPARPAGTEDLSVEELEKLVTRDSMIGVMDALPSVPE